MKKNHVYILVLVALLLTIISFFYKPLLQHLPAYDLKEGQLSEYDIIAPYTFHIQKSPEQIKIEEQASISQVHPIYVISEDIQFNSLKKINTFFEIISQAKSDSDSSQINRNLQQNDLAVSHKTLVDLIGKQQTQTLYSALTSKISSLMAEGVYESIRYDSISVYEGAILIEKPISQYRNMSKAISETAQVSIPTISKTSITELAKLFLAPNLIVDKEKTEALYSQVKSQVQKTTGTVQKNEEIIRKNERVTTDAIQKIQSMLADPTNKKQVIDLKLIISILGNFLLNLLVMLGFYLIMILYFPAHNFTVREIILIWSGLLFNAIMTIVMTQVFSIHYLALPYSMSILMICIIFNTNLGLLYNFINFVIISQYLNWQIFDPMILTIATMGAVLSLKRIGDKQDYLNIGLYLLISMIFVNFAFSLYRTDPLMVLLKHLLYSVISTTLSIVGLILIVPWVERKLNIASKQTLLELLDFNHPILKKLSSNAMGTYHHSLIVGNLSESAAEAIGANPLLARVGSYYHDIGKISNPMIFTENNRDSDQIHDHLPPLESASKIRAHVNEGVAMARKKKIPQAVIDIIQQHHGTGVIRYFLNKAEQEGMNIDLTKYQYAGPKPISKEAALVMIADIVESTSKSMTDPSSDSIRKMIDETIFRLIRDGQLDDAPITIQELDIVKKKMLPIIESIYRKRLQYPEDKQETDNR